ncbi:hypothetical protein [uncultured Modestobacter sp.]|uniref:hypothetical protein n=1 Tax=uncultured Modestobacter sp. TaxID=380048 RepID=UPI0026288038|nr:hypothetical protein [uncultured Modestobacter sp.]
MTAVTQAVTRGKAGHPDEARTQLAALWERVGPAGDPLHRVSIAHFLADLQDDVRAELAWDERALAAVGELTDRRTEQHTAGLTVRGFLPSLHLNLADCHRRLGAATEARRHLAEAVSLLDALADDAYGRLMRAAVDHVRDALDAGSTDPLPTAP